MLLNNHRIRASLCAFTVIYGTLSVPETSATHVPETSAQTDVNDDYYTNEPVFPNIAYPHPEDLEHLRMFGTSNYDCDVGSNRNCTVNLYEIDPVTGDASYIANIRAVITGLTYDAYTETMYFTTNNWANSDYGGPRAKNATCLFTIDLEDGATELVSCVPNETDMCGGNYRAINNPAVYDGKVYMHCNYNYTIVTYDLCEETWTETSRQITAPYDDYPYSKSFDIDQNGTFHMLHWGGAGETCDIVFRRDYELGDDEPDTYYSMAAFTIDMGMELKSLETCMKPYSASDSNDYYLFGRPWHHGSVRPGATEHWAVVNKGWDIDFSESEVANPAIPYPHNIHLGVWDYYNRNVTSIIPLGRNLPIDKSIKTIEWVEGYSKGKSGMSGMSGSSSGTSGRSRRSGMSSMGKNKCKKGRKGSMGKKSSLAGTSVESGDKEISSAAAGAVGAAVGCILTALVAARLRSRAQHPSHSETTALLSGQESPLA